MVWFSEGELLVRQLQGSVARSGGAAGLSLDKEITLDQDLVAYL